MSAPALYPGSHINFVVQNFLYLISLLCVNLIFKTIGFWFFLSLVLFPLSLRSPSPLIGCSFRECLTSFVDRQIHCDTCCQHVIFFWTSTDFVLYDISYVAQHVHIRLLSMCRFWTTFLLFDMFNFL